MAGNVTISLEVELGWGYHDLDRPDRFYRLSRNRAAETRMLDRLLALCEDLDVHLTFDVVGHLFLDSCDGAHKGQHHEGWFDADPGSDRETDPLFYAPDLVEAIVESDVDHEIGTHTFSHVLADEVSRDVLAWELERVREQHERYDIDPPTSIVCPRHRPAPNSVLTEHGVDVERQHESSGASFYLYRWANHRWHRTRTPVVEDDVLVTTTTHSLSSPLLQNGQQPPPLSAARGPLALRQRIHEWYLKQGLAAAASRDGYVHYWTHLHNLANDQHWVPVKRFLQRLSDHRNAGRLRVQRMCDLPESLPRDRGEGRSERTTSI